MGNVTASQKTQMENKGTEMMREYKEMKGGKERLSAQQFRKSMMKKRSATSKTSVDLADAKLKEMLADKDVVSFKDFLKFEIEMVSMITTHNNDPKGRLFTTSILSQGAEGSDLTGLLTDLFKEIDDGDGFLTPEELIKAEEAFNVTLSEEQATDIIRTYDTNGDGRMDLEDFLLYKNATLVNCKNQLFLQKTLYILYYNR